MKKLDLSRFVLDIRKLGYEISVYTDLDKIMGRDTKNIIPILLNNLTHTELENEKNF